MNFLEHPLNRGSARNVRSRASLERFRGWRGNDASIGRSRHSNGLGGKSFSVVLSLSDGLVLGRDFDGRFGDNKWRRKRFKLMNILSRLKRQESASVKLLARTKGIERNDPAAVTQYRDSGDKNARYITWARSARRVDASIDRRWVQNVLCDSNLVIESRLDKGDKIRQNRIPQARRRREVGGGIRNWTVHERNEE